MAAAFRYIDAAGQLEELAELLDRARLACFDCEWPPSGPPKASLLQLALLTPERADDDSGLQTERICARYERHLVLVDVQELVAQGQLKALRRVLLDMLSSETLKLAHSLTNDASALLRALDLPLEHHGSMRTAVDVRQLMARLNNGAGFKHIGLSAMLEILTGWRLSKELQCSDWAARPLRDAQAHYAAVDAACLVDLFACAVRMYAGVASDAGIPVSPSTSRVSDGAHDSGESLEEASGTYYSIEAGPHFIDLPSMDTSVFQIFGQHWRYEGSKWRVIRDDDSIFWKSTRPCSKKKGRRRQGSGAATSLVPRACTASLLPSDIPWVDPKEARFVCDDMCGGLARELRLFGVDCELVETPPRQQRFLTHRRLVELADADGRVILTRDVSFYRRRLSQRLYLVQNDESKRQQSEEVMRVFGCVESCRGMLMSRCATCNGTLRLMSDSTNLPEWVPDGVRTSVDAFWACSRDDTHVYWRGGQYQRSLERLQGQLESVSIQ